MNRFIESSIPPPSKVKRAILCLSNKTFKYFSSLSDKGELKKKLERIALKFGAIIEQVFYHFYKTILDYKIYLLLPLKPTKMICYVAKCL